jgi:predicted Zn-dependent protease
VNTPNLVSFGKETINLSNVTHITIDKRLDIPFIRFTFIGGEHAVRFSQLTDQDKPNPAYYEAKAWLDRLQSDVVQQQQMREGE